MCAHSRLQHVTITGKHQLLGLVSRSGISGTAKALPAHDDELELMLPTATTNSSTSNEPPALLWLVPPSCLICDPFLYGTRYNRVGIPILRARRLKNAHPSSSLPSRAPAVLQQNLSPSLQKRVGLRPSWICLCWSLRNGPPRTESRGHQVRRVR